MFCSKTISVVAYFVAFFSIFVIIKSFDDILVLHRHLCSKHMFVHALRICQGGKPTSRFDWSEGITSNYHIVCGPHTYHSFIEDFSVK